MSRVILNDHPWSDEEIEYQKGRNRIKEIAKNQEMFPRDKAPEKIDLDEDIVSKVKELSDEDLVNALSQRGLSTDGTVKEQKFRLAEDVQKERNARDS
jgi:hypothetical protein